MAVAAQELETTRRQRFVDVKVTAEKKAFKNAQFKRTYGVNTRKTPVEVDCFKAIFKYAPALSLACVFAKKNH